MKLQLLPGLLQDVKHFGLAIRNSTEVFECFNTIFHLCSVLSNHLAPRHNISQKFASMNRVKRVLSGGFWFDEESGNWVNTRGDVWLLLHSQPILQCHLGWMPPQAPCPGWFTANHFKTSSIIDSCVRHDSLSVKENIEGTDMVRNQGSWVANICHSQPISKRRAVAAGVSWGSSIKQQVCHKVLGGGAACSRLSFAF